MMKPVLIFLIVLLPFIVGKANAQASPRDGFQLLLSVTKLSLQRGETDSVKISVLRSRSYKKGNTVFSISSPEINGIDVRMRWTLGAPDTCLLIVSAKETAVPGDYNIIPSCALNQKKTGAILKVTIR